MKKMLVMLLSFCLFLTTACSKKEAFLSTDITGAAFGATFSLPDFHGKTRQLSDFRGKVVVLFFGYTHCPDICPTTLSELAVAMKRLGKLAEKVQVIFVTVDPKRDTNHLLAQYMPAFYPSFLGLRGTEAEIQQLANEFKVFYQKQGKGEHYTIDHSAGAFIFDPQGRLRLWVNYGAGEKVFSHDIRLLIEE